MKVNFIDPKFFKQDKDAIVLELDIIPRVGDILYFDKSIASETFIKNGDPFGNTIRAFVLKVIHSFGPYHSIDIEISIDNSNPNN